MRPQLDTSHVNPFLLHLLLPGGGQEDEGRLEHEEQVHEHPGQEEGHQGLRRAEGASGVSLQSSNNRPDSSSPSSNSDHPISWGILSSLLYLVNTPPLPQDHSDQTAAATGSVLQLNFVFCTAL